MFVNDLLRMIGWVLITGGFLSMGSLVWQWIDYLYVNRTIGAFLSRVQYVVVRIYPPSNNTGSIAEMESFFARLAVVYAPKAPLDYYVDGTWHTSFTFEIHSSEGKIGLYCRLASFNLSLFKSSMDATFPGAVVEVVEDPLATYPSTFNLKNGIGTHKGMVGSELTYRGGEKLLKSDGFSNDVFSLKSWRDFQRDDKTPIADPILQLFSVLRGVKPGNNVIVQYVTVPYGRDNIEVGLKEKWKLWFNLLKAKFAEDSVHEIATDDKGNTAKTPLLTLQEKAILDQMSRKIAGQIYMCKIRVAIFNDNSNDKSIFGELMSFFESWASDIVGLGPAKGGKTWDKDSGDKFGVLGPWFATAANQIYWQVQSDFQRKSFYRAFRHRDLGSLTNPTYFSVENLAGLFHFPVTSEYTVGKNQIAEQLSDGFGDSDSRSVNTNSPSNLPT
jgi:hypothetical protein